MTATGSAQAAEPRDSCLREEADRSRFLHFTLNKPRPIFARSVVWAIVIDAFDKLLADLETLENGDER